MTGSLRWAADQLSPGDSLKQHRYADFFDVTELEVLAHVEPCGFPGIAVHEDDDLTTKAYDDQFRIRMIAEESPPRYSVYYIERGKRYDEKVHDSLREARLDAIHRVMKGTEIVLDEWRQQGVV